MHSCDAGGGRGLLFRENSVGNTSCVFFFQVLVADWVAVYECSHVMHIQDMEHSMSFPILRL